jgi:hypothetical protein
MGQFGGGGAPNPGIKIVVQTAAIDTVSLLTTPKPATQKDQPVTITWANGQTVVYDYWTGAILK